MRTPASKKPDASHASPARRAAAGRRRPERSTRRRTEGCGGGSGGQDTKIYGGSDGVQRWGDARNGEQQAAAAKGAPATESSGAYLLGLRGTVCIRRTVGCSSSERRQRATWHNGGGGAPAAGSSDCIYRGCRERRRGATGRICWGCRRTAAHLPGSGLVHPDPLFALRWTKVVNVYVNSETIVLLSDLYLRHERRANGR